MSSTSTIEWTDATWNPVTGCDRVSPGCAHCYALTLAKRLKAIGNPRYQRDGDARTSGPGFGVTLHQDVLGLPLRWRKPRRVFVNSMSDLFHEEIPDEYIDRVFAVMAWAHEHTFQVLTKRPERMRDYILGAERRVETAMCDACMGKDAPARGACGWYGEDCCLSPILWPLPNVWLGTSIENRRFVDRADSLRETPAAVRFISAEPLLGPLVASGEVHTVGTVLPGDVAYYWHDGRRTKTRGLDLTDIHWLIVGGESGPGHRPIKTEWVRDLRDDAAASGTAFFFKQWGGRTPKAGGRELDGRTWEEMPDPLRRLIAA